MGINEMWISKNASFSEVIGPSICWPHPPGKPLKICFDLQATYCKSKFSRHLKMAIEKVRSFIQFYQTVSLLSNNNNNLGFMIVIYQPNLLEGF